MLPKQIDANGIGQLNLEFSDETLKTLIGGYTKEAGVRGLNREIEAVCRKVARSFVMNNHAGQDIELDFTVTPKRLAQYLGPAPFRQRGRVERDEIGLVHGLAVTSYGGDLLSTEVSVVAGKGRLDLTGKLGEVMQESAHAAMSYVRARCGSLGLASDFHARTDVHVHLPEGAVPKDGPSAGITICTALVSALLRVPVRHDVAMTGEVTLRGRVLGVGGLKDKILAAQRHGIRKVILPAENESALADVPKAVLDDLDIVPVSHMDDVLREALRIDADAAPDLALDASFLTEGTVAMDWRTGIASVGTGGGSSRSP